MDNRDDDMTMDLDLNPIRGLDLNQEPPDQSAGSAVLGLGSLFSELETAHGQIEERIRQLDALTERVRQRQRWRQAQSPPETSIALTETTGSTAFEGTLLNVEYGIAPQEGMVDRAKSCKRDSNPLVAKALEMDTDVNKLIGDGGGYFDCSICLDMAREPILTSCGHLFCWVCFYQLPCLYSTAKECPVCKGEVSDMSVTPVYGNGNSTSVSEFESSLKKVPPRPQARRIESIRQQRISRGISHIPVAEALRRIRLGIGATAEQPQRQDLDSVSVSPDRMPSQGSNVLPVNADSLSSFSSALDNAERLVDELESFIRRGRVLSSGREDPFTRSVPVEQSEHPTVDSVTVINSAAPLVSTAEGVNVSASDVNLEHQRIDATAGINLNEPHFPSSSRRRIRLSRVSDPDNGVAREPRRRRLN